MARPVPKLHDQAAIMPPLNGKPLQPPAFFEVDWKPSQKFSEEDDPDRTSIPWPTPSFVKNVDPKQRSKQTKITQMRVPNMGKQSLAQVATNVLTEEECADIISMINKKGFTPALLNIGKGNQMLAPEHRDGHRMIADSPELTQWLFQVLEPHLPESIYKSKISEINERCRFLAYGPGQQFLPHCDGQYTRHMQHPKGGDTSQITLQVYLHTIPAENGGATTFLPYFKGEKKVPYHPVAGSILMFTQDLYHEGSLVNKGIKYTMRTEVMYTPNNIVRHWEPPSPSPASP